jgi:O-antigen/teichoic acid export membrane protein
VLLAAGVNVPGALLLVLFGSQITNLWLGEGRVEIPQSLLVSFGLWLMLNAIGGPLAMLLNGANIVRFQAVTAVAMAIVNVGLSVLFTGWIGVAGPVLGSVVAQLTCIVLPSMFYVSRMWNR